MGGTNFGLVLRKAMQDFKRSTPEGSTTALVILSDGEDTVNSSLEIAEEAKESNLLVITVGIGTAAGGPIPDARGENGLYQDTNGKHVISKLNTESLSQFAKATGGDFFVMDSNANLAAFTQAAVSKIDKHEEAFSLNKIPNDLFTPFASTALLLLIFVALSSTEWTQYKHFIILLLLGGMTPGIQAAPAEESATAFKLGLEHMRSGEKEKAKEAFSTALLDEDTALQAASLYQLGQINATATFDELRALYGESPTEGIDEGSAAPQQVTPEALQKIVDSLKQDVQPYHDALKLQPGLARARKNIAGIEQLIKKLEEEIERLKQQQQEQQDQQQQQNNEQNQNQQQDDQQKSDKDQEDKEDNQNQKDDSEQKEESQDKQDQQNPQDKKDDSQNKQDSEQNQQQEQENQSQDNQQDQQQEQPEQKDAPQQGDKQEQQDTQAPQPQKEQPSDEEKARRYAASVLRSHMDEEQGSPIPHADMQVRPPDKDY